MDKIKVIKKLMHFDCFKDEKCTEAWLDTCLDMLPFWAHKIDPKELNEDSFMVVEYCPGRFEIKVDGNIIDTIDTTNI